MRRVIRSGIGTAVAVLLLPIAATAARLEPKAQSGFNQYVAGVETRLEHQHSNSEDFVAGIPEGLSARNRTLEQLKSGTVMIESVPGQSKPLPGALLHHWRGTAFVPGATASEMLTLLRSYRDLPRNYAPEIESAHVLSEQPGKALIRMRIKRTQVVTIVLDGEFDVRTFAVGPKAGYSASRSNHIWEIEAPDTSHEKRLPEGDDDGFLWRLNSYWSFVEVPGGLVIECEAVSLTRDVPAGLGWLVAPIVEQLPRESLAFTLQATQRALAAMAAKETRQ